VPAFSTPRVGTTQQTPGSYGAGLTQVLLDQGVAMVEVDRPDRRTRRQQGKSDPIDAEAAARAVLAGTATAVPKRRDGIVESIRAPGQLMWSLTNLPGPAKPGPGNAN